MRRRFLVIVLLAVVVASGAWTLAWYVAAHRLIDAVDRWAAARRDEGWQVGHGVPTLAGFPAKVAVEFADPAITGPAPRAGGGGSWEWRARSIRVEFVPWRPHRIVLRNSGINSLALVRDATRYDATLATAGALVRLEFGRREAADGATDGAQYVVELASPKFRLAAPPITAEAALFAMTTERHRVPPGDHLALAADLDIAIDGLVAEVLDKASGLPVSAHLRAELMGALPPGSIEAALAAWRDDGGTVEVRRLTLQSSGITMVTNGTLALDNQMRPMGAATATIRGFDEALDRLTAAGTVNRRDAQLAKLLLSAIATPSAGGERVLNVPITGQDGWLYVGPVRLTRLEPLNLR
jgi:hypothetical protein